MKRLRKKTQPFLLGLVMQFHAIPFWKHAPFIRLLPAFVIGILLQYYYPHASHAELLAILIFSLLLFFLQLNSIQKRFKYRILQGFCLVTLMISLGSILCRERTVHYKDDWMGHHYKDSTGLLLKLIDDPIERKKTFKTTALVQAILKKGKWVHIKGKVLVYLSKESAATTLRAGSYLITNKPLQPIMNLVNPGSFNYRAYCMRQGIHHSLFLQSKQYNIIPQYNHTVDWLASTKKYVLTILRKHISGDQEKAIAEALLIGYTNDLDDELLQAYSKTGVIHVIAISGMHLGLIYGILLLLTRPIQRIRWIKWMRPILILLALWSFSFLVGAGPSVLRAAIICSFVLIGDSFDRKTNIYNTLAASAFCLLLINPFYLWDIGFQLSYTAVLGIVLFTKSLFRLFYLPFKPIRHIWQLCTVTLSAQVLTIPIILYHFHQFPNLFLLTNLLIAPLSGLMLYGCILLLLLAPINIIANYLGKLIYQTIRLMNEIIQYAEQLSFSVTNHIELKSLQVCCYYLIIIFLGCWIQYKKPKWLLASLGCATIFLGMYAVRQIEIRQKARLIVYQMPGNRLIDIAAGGSYISLLGEKMQDSSENTHNATRTLLGIFSQKAMFKTSTKPVLSIYGRTVVFIDRPPILNSIDVKIPVDILIIQNNPSLSISALSRAFDCDLYVFDGNNSLWKIRKWKKEADSLHLRHHSVPELGAFVMNF